MNYNSNNFFLLTFVLFVINIYLTEVSAKPYLEPPVMPKRLDNPEDFQKYLAKLQQYYLVAGRPRFVFVILNYTL